jgi:hypothetical protein
LDIYAKDSLKPKKESKTNFSKGEVKSTVYNIIHAKKLSSGGFKTKDEAVASAVELLGDKAALYGLV